MVFSTRLWVCPLIEATTRSPGTCRKDVQSRINNIVFIKKYVHSYSQKKTSKEIAHELCYYDQNQKIFLDILESYAKVK